VQPTDTTAMANGTRQCKEGIIYFRDDVHDLFAIDGYSQYGHPDPESLPERLNILTKTAQRLGFMSIQDAALADSE